VAHAQTAAVSLSPAQVAAACAPALTLPRPPASQYRIVGAQDTVPRSLFGVRDLIIVNGGTGDGVQVNQEYFIRRQHVFGGGSRAWQTIHTAGWLRIVSVNETTAIGQIETVCDGVMAGDYLEPFAAPAPVADGEPLAFADLDFSSLARVMFGIEERMMGVPGDFMLVASRDATLTPGARVAVYRDLRTSGVPLTAIGEGVIVSLKDGTPLMRITSARDAVRSGDYVVPRK
jgi:hypothetical protein